MTKTKKIIAKIKEIKEASRGFVVSFEGVDGGDSL